MCESESSFSGFHMFFFFLFLLSCCLGSQCQHRRTGRYQSHQTGTRWVISTNSALASAECSANQKQGDGRSWRLYGPEWWRYLDWIFGETALKPALLFPLLSASHVQILVHTGERRGNTNGLLTVQNVRFPCRWGLCCGPAGDHHDEGLQTLQHRGLFRQLSTVSWRSGVYFFYQVQDVKSFLPRVHRCVRVLEDDLVVFLRVLDCSSDGTNQGQDVIQTRSKKNHHKMTSYFFKFDFAFEWNSNISFQQGDWVIFFHHFLKIKKQLCLIK